MPTPAPPAGSAFLGEATVAFDGMMMGMPYNDDVGNRLLTLDGGTIYYQTNLFAPSPRSRPRRARSAGWRPIRTPRPAAAARIAT